MCPNARQKIIELITQQVYNLSDDSILLYELEAITDGGLLAYILFKDSLKAIRGLDLNEIKEEYNKIKKT